MNHLASVIFINIACNIPFATFMFRSFVATIPEELEEAAKIDGAGTFRTFLENNISSFKTDCGNGNNTEFPDNLE